MKKLHIAASIAALGILGAASAQNNNAPSDFALRAGIVFPIDNNLRSASNLWYGVGVDYVFPNQVIRLGKDSETYVSVDWFGRSTSGQRGNVFPLALNQRFFTSVKSGGLEKYGRTYVTVGAGAAIIDVNGSSATKWLFRGGMGVELSHHLSAEAILTISDKTAANVRANAVGVYFGYRF